MRRVAQAMVESGLGTCQPEKGVRGSLHFTGQWTSQQAYISWEDLESFRITAWLEKSVSSSGVLASPLGHRSEAMVANHFCQ